MYLEQDSAPTEDFNEEIAEKLAEDFSADATGQPTFASLGLPPAILDSVTKLGFTTPTEIQAQAIPVLLSGRDVLGVAQTGTGKTAAFGLPLLSAVDASAAHVQALVLTPTRELAMQVGDALTTFASDIDNLKVVTVYGGSAYGPQIGALEDGAQIVVGTPGRTRDLISRGKLDLSSLRFFVLDEADEMLSMGFDEEVAEIAEKLPAERRNALFSATMKDKVSAIAETYLVDPAHISVTPPASTVSTVTQTYAVVPVRHKLGALARVLATMDAEAAIVFVRTRSTADDVAIELGTRGIQAAAISGDVAQKDREKLIDRLRSGTLDVLVATDVAARGLDVERIGLVVNFDVPRETDAYVHRIGRTGRAGREGLALTFFTPKEQQKLKQIERATGAKVMEVEIPSPADVSAHLATRVLAKIPPRLELGRLDIYYQALEKAQSEGLDLGDLAATLLALAVGDMGPRKTRGTTTETEEEFTSAHFAGGKGAKLSTGRGRLGTRYRVEVGHKDKVYAGSIVGAIAGEAGIKGSQIGRIEIFQTFSLVDIEADLNSTQLRKLQHAEVAGRALRLRLDTGGKKARTSEGARPRRQRDDFASFSHDLDRDFSRGLEPTTHQGRATGSSDAPGDFATGRFNDRDNFDSRRRPAKGDRDNAWSRRESRPAKTEGGFKKGKRSHLKPTKGKSGGHGASSFGASGFKSGGFSSSRFDGGKKKSHKNSRFGGTSWAR